MEKPCHCRIKGGQEPKQAKAVIVYLLRPLTFYILCRKGKDYSFPAGSAGDVSVSEDT